MLGGLADAVDALIDVGVEPTPRSAGRRRSREPCRCNVATTLFSVPVVVPPPGEYVADGAARQAAWVLAGSAAPPLDWEPPCTTGRPRTASLREAPERAVAESYSPALSRRQRLPNRYSTDAEP